MRIIPATLLAPTVAVSTVRPLPHVTPEVKAKRRAANRRAAASRRKNRNRS